MKHAWVGLLLLLGGCAELVTSTPQAIEASRYVSPEAPYVALLTMVDRDSGQGAHSALLVNGSQRVLYDPAGTFKTEVTTENADVIYGITPLALQAYEFFHARETTSFLEQKISVSRAEADAMIARMERQGPSPKFMCAINTAEILRDFDRFAHMPRSMQPTRLMKAFDAMPGVERREVFDDDVGQNIRWAKPGEL